jgi:hypothetical protein
MWHHVTNHLITSNDKDSNSENRIKLRVRDTTLCTVVLDPSVQGGLPTNAAPKALRDSALVHNLVKSALPFKVPIIHSVLPGGGPECFTMCRNHL